MLKRISRSLRFLCVLRLPGHSGSTIFYRTYNRESGLAARASTWERRKDSAPAIAYEWPEEKTVEVEEKGKKISGRSGRFIGAGED